MTSYNDGEYSYRLLRYASDRFYYDLKAATALLRTNTMAEELDLFASDNTESVEIDDPFANEVEVASSSLELLESVELNAEELAEQEAELFLVAGDYTWNDGTVTITIRHSETDKMPKDIFPTKGRTFIQLGGVVVNSSTKRKGRFSFTLSPDTRLAIDENAIPLEPPQHDFFTNNWAKCISFFFKCYERKPKKPSEVVAMLERCKYSIYITQSKKNGANYLGNFKEL